MGPPHTAPRRAPSLLLLAVSRRGLDLLCVDCLKDCGAGPEGTAKPKSGRCDRTALNDRGAPVGPHQRSLGQGSPSRVAERSATALLATPVPTSVADRSAPPAPSSLQKPGSRRHHPLPYAPLGKQIWQVGNGP
eukprot:649085-Pyramimonas_sp.AAC.1